MKIHLADYPKWVERMGERAKAAVKRGLYSGAMRCIQELQRSTEAVGAVNTGEYRRRWKAAPTEKGARVYNDSVQAGPLERGRRPGTMPPLAAIEKWAMRKLHLDEKAAKKAAYPIAKAIKANGLKPRMVMGRIRIKMATIVREEVRREVEREMKK